MRQLSLEIGRHLQTHQTTRKWVIWSCLPREGNINGIAMGHKADRPRRIIT